jgi:outer membrane protein assembly factor BamB
LKPSGAPLVRPDAVLVLLTNAGMDYRALVSMDAALGRINWRREAPAHWTTTRVFATQKTVVLGAPTGEVMAYCLADGAPAWSQKLASVAIRSIGGSDEMLFVGTPAGTLYAIRPPRSCM